MGLTLSSYGPPHDRINFYVLSGTCSQYRGTLCKRISTTNLFAPPNSPLFSNNVTVTSSGTHTYTTSSFFTSSTAGNYVWLTYCTGSIAGYPVQPSQVLHNDVRVQPLNYENFTLTQSTGVPQFPLGTFGMFALIGMSPLPYGMRAKFARNVAN